MDLSKLDQYLEGFEVILNEDVELRKTIEELDKTLKELDKQKGISADILMDFRGLTKRIEKILKKPANHGLTEKFSGFGTNGTLEIFGDDVTISKNGKSVTITKRELADIVIKSGIAKRKVR